MLGQPDWDLLRQDFDFPSPLNSHRDSAGGNAQVDQDAPRRDFGLLKTYRDSTTGGFEIPRCLRWLQLPFLGKANFVMI